MRFMFLIPEQDHLHMCGEYFIVTGVVDSLIGSPPHVWRIPLLTCYILLLIRITSTCVENTLLAGSKGKQLEDHLHMCGEYNEFVFESFGKSGSPPHVWRIHYFEHGKQFAYRITSTCVENTF